MNRQDLKALNDYLMGTTPKSIEYTGEIDTKAIIADFNDKWAMFASIKNKEAM